jgi:hypothetical protein
LNAPHDGALTRVTHRHALNTQHNNARQSYSGGPG